MSLTIQDAGNIENLKSLVDGEGMVVIRGVQKDEAGILHFARMLGSHELDIPERLSGPPVMHLRFDREKALGAARQAYFTSGEFPLHTDLSYVPSPPNYLLTLCVAADELGGGVSKLASLQDAGQRLSSEDRAVLMQPCFSFENAPNTGEGICANRPIHDVSEGNECWRFRQDTLQYPPGAARAVDNLTAVLEENVVHVTLQAGDLLVLDNHRIAHGRTAFNVPSKRHLLRTYAD